VRRVTALLTATAALITPGVAAAVAAKTTLTAVEKDMMCVVCKEPLAVSQSPQADAERALISRLIAAGETKAQIEQAMVANYGPAVLGLPPAHGFNLTLYVLPPVVLLAGAAVLVYTLPRWRRRTRAAASTQTATPAPEPKDARRLEEDLARYGR
jgi:cytochrome c-type biogenesis protein CcmH